MKEQRENRPAARGSERAPEDREEAEGGRPARASGRVGPEGTPRPGPSRGRGKADRGLEGQETLHPVGTSYLLGLFSLDRSSSLCVAAL